ncbi:MAG: ArgE/DapE family deacylase [Lysobacterales bacterium]|jgi:acetylornithine deacetylase
MNERESRVLDAIDMDGLIETLCELITFRSCDGQEVAAQQRMARLFDEAGLETDCWEIDLEALRRHPAYGAEIERDRALGVVGRWNGGDGPALILNGHIDVVPAGKESRWTLPPWNGTVRDGRVYGRGAADMKGGLCCALFAVRALRKAGVSLGGSVMIQSVAGEEDGGLGTLAAIERGHTADAAIILEPTCMTIAPAQAGALSFRITIPGRAAHGALRTEGVNPLDKFNLVYDALTGLERRRNERMRHPLFADYEIPYAICVGKAQGGIWASTVAESLVLEGRYGVAIDEDIVSARAELEAAVDDAAQSDNWLREHPPAVEWWGARFQSAAIPAEHPLVASLAEGFRDVTGRQPHIQGMPFGADMHLLVQQGGIPTVIFGPGDIRHAHVPDEFVPLPELESVTRALALTILRFCQ